MCLLRSFRLVELEVPRESTDDANLGMWKMRWKNGGFFASAADEAAEWGECCDAFVPDVAVRREGAPGCCVPYGDVISVVVVVARARAGSMTHDDLHLLARCGQDVVCAA